MRVLTRFSTRQMIVLVTVLAVPLALWSWRMRAGISFPTRFDLVPIGISAFTAILVWDLLARSTGRVAGCLHLIWPGILALNILISIWFTSVDWTWIHEDCTRCGHGRNFIESRFFSIAPHIENVREYPTWIELIACDLGIPCTHASRSSWKKQRWLGGCFPVELNDGIDRLSGTNLYSECVSDAIRSWAAEDPTLTITFRSKALDSKDRQYLRDLNRRIQDACPDDR
jgi:hypothetical protein